MRDKTQYYKITTGIILISSIIFFAFLIIGIAEDNGNSQNNLSDTIQWVDVITGEEFFNIHDIMRFDWNKQIFELRREAAIKLKSKETSLYRKFNVINSKAKIYSGVFVSPLCSIAFPEPSIIMSVAGIGVAPPLYQIEGGYPGTIMDSNDVRFSDMLRVALKQADKLTDIDINHPPKPIKSNMSNWFGEKDKLKIMTEVFPETFKLQNPCNVNIHLQYSRNYDKNHIVEINATLISEDGKDKFSRKQMFPISSDTTQRIICPVKIDPWNYNQPWRSEIKSGLANLIVEAAIRKKTFAKTYSKPIECVKTDAIGIFIQPGRKLLSGTHYEVFSQFQNTLRNADWQKTLEYCSDEIKAKAQEYNSPGVFFKDILPLDKIIALEEFEISGTSGKGGNATRYSCEIPIQDPNYEWPMDWQINLCKRNTAWVIEFPTKPLNIWLKHAVLTSKVINRKLQVDKEKCKTGYEFILTPLADKFTIGKPMPFRIEMKNISNESLPYTKKNVTAQNPMIITGPNGNKVKYVGRQCSIGIMIDFTEPGETVVLAYNYNAGADYHIVKPGKYTFQFKGDYGISSNTEEINIGR